MQHSIIGIGQDRNNDQQMIALERQILQPHLNEEQFKVVLETGELPA